MPYRSIHNPSRLQVAIKQIDLEDSDDDITEIQQVSIYRRLSCVECLLIGVTGNCSSGAMRFAVCHAVLLFLCRQT